MGVIEKIPHFEELGVTAVELMPVQDFNENELQRVNPLTGQSLRNDFGYNTISFLAPKESYSTRCEPGCQMPEFEVMVKELHRAGIEVILDIVLNHTAEGSELGPALHFRGIGNSIYYLLEDARRFCRNYSGCGNTLKCNHLGQLPVLPVRDQEGEWLRMALNFPGRPLRLRMWEAKVGRVKLYLSDSNHPANSPADQCIRVELCGGGQELRLQQELVLGVGGWQLLRIIKRNRSTWPTLPSGGWHGQRGKPASWRC